MNEYAKRKKTHRYRKQTGGYQRGKGVGEGQIRAMGLTDTHYYIYKTNKQQGPTLWQREL